MISMYKLYDLSLQMQFTTIFTTLKNIHGIKVKF